ncbi:hypothetical protein RAA17_22395 [Komagataeibacter rhaeticus]|nr:hypothetical protein [Komagataeibacter rhaeticus]
MKEKEWIDVASNEIFSEFFSFISGSEKIDYVLSKIKSDDLNNMRLFIKACRLKRNSIHNLGVSKAENFDISLHKDRKIKIHKDKKVFQTTILTLYFYAQNSLNVIKK